MIELERWSCPSCSTTIDVWLEDGQPEDLRATACPNCVVFEGIKRVPVYCAPDPAATALWEAS